MRQLLSKLGNPHEKYQIIHVAGTKGKGTTSTLLADMLSACGVPTGLYTSPHLLKIEQRMCMDGRCATRDEFVALVDRVKVAAAELDSMGAGKPTFFELTTAMGMLFFAHHQAEFVVLEVGLGGRLDSTNVCVPILSIITSISLDHQAQLGNTIEEIAFEKAGIIKAHVPLVCTARNSSARKVILRCAEQLSAPVRLLQRDFDCQWRCISSQRDNEDAGLPSQASVYYTELVHSNENGSFISKAVSETESSGEWHTRLLGSHQAENLAGAITALKWIEEMGLIVPWPKARRAARHSGPSARLEIVGWNPLRIIDVAHNPASVFAAMRAVREHFPGLEPKVVFATSRDKDYIGMLEMLLPACSSLVFTNYRENPRGLPADELASAAKLRFGELPNTSIVADPLLAWQLACREAGSENLVLAVGSFFLAAELLGELSSPARQAASMSSNPSH
ncbi:MAG: bifunctional folylpolyglutamate synthase/dihydrofolate synthase [Planctomycetales bacterium]|nr:bifunctional folylpolyglutamate synthase/dihydrofolate synthase [Planctomycetales bacterium]